MTGRDEIGMPGAVGTAARGLITALGASRQGAWLSAAVPEIQPSRRPLTRGQPPNVPHVSAPIIISYITDLQLLGML
jgi:hypothetical protein